MELVTIVLLGLGMGLVFGIALEKSRVFEPGVIIGQLQLRNFIMLKMFLAAVITGLLVLAVLNGVWGVALHPKALLWKANLLGGLMLGAGLAIAGACPGTVMAQVGTGYRDAWFTLAGGLFGAMAYGYAQPALKPLLASGGPGKVTLAGLTGVPFWLLALAAAALLIMLVIAIERLQPWTQEIGDDLDGLRDDSPGATGAGRVAEA